MTIAVISMIRDPWGGSEELWYDMAKTALHEGHTVIHLAYAHKRTHPKMEELKGMGLVACQRPGYIRPGSGAISRLIQVGINFIRKKITNPLLAIMRYNPDAILYNGTAYAIAQEKELLRLLSNSNVPFYLLSHFNPKPASGLDATTIQSVRSAYQRAKRVFFISGNGKSTAEADLGCTIPNATIVKNPVNLPNTQLVPFPPGDIPVQFAMIGNLVTVHKGQDIVLSVLQQPIWAERKWHLHIYGSGSDETMLKNMASAKTLSGKITFHGRVEDIRGIWQSNHLLLLPSRMEGMPLVIVEAMLCGRPCVATPVGGITEWVEDGRTGFIAAAATPDAFDAAMERAWQAMANWAAMGRDAHDRALQLYDPEAGRSLLRYLCCDR